MEYIGRFLMITILVLVSCSRHVNISSENLDFCIKDYSKNGCFLAIDVSIDSIIYPCVIRNFDLSYYFFKKRGYNRDNAYQKVVKSIVLGKEELVITRYDTINYGFRIIRLSSPVIKDLNTGERYVIEKYFRPGTYGGYIIRESAIEYWPEIVYALFIKYGIICRSYDETGYINISDKQLAK